ncbi:MAG: hypothetical protein R6W95_09875 [Desulfosarcina sp.]
MLHVGYGIGGVGLALLLLGGWILWRLRTLQAVPASRGLSAEPDSVPSNEREIDPRALMVMVTRKTDTLLAALARTIDQERQKLGIAVRDPSITAALDPVWATAPPSGDGRRADVDQIVVMAREGVPAAMIARRLQLPEAQVAMVMRLNAP